MTLTELKKIQPNYDHIKYRTVFHTFEINYLILFFFQERCVSIQPDSKIMKQTL